MINSQLRIKIVKMIKNAGEGHIPSAFSIIDIINYLYSNILNVNLKNYNSNERDYFLLSKGHGCAALYAVLNKFKILTDLDLNYYSTSSGILGGHPDSTKVPGIEACTGSLGHGFPTAIGIALGLKIQQKENKVIVLLGDGECHEGTIWESAHVGRNLMLGNICAIIDANKSANQLMPVDNLIEKWKSFGWNVFNVNGHSNEELNEVFLKIKFNFKQIPNVIIADTIKGKGVGFLEGHGVWHHKIPNNTEFQLIIDELSK